MKNNINNVTPTPKKKFIISLQLVVMYTSLSFIFGGCATVKVNYASNVGDPEALKTKANIYVIINESGLSKHFRKAETKQSIIDAVKNDLATNLFSIG